MSGCTAGCRQPSDTNAHCPTCHRTFGSVSGFDVHRQPPDGPRVGARRLPDAGPVNVCVDPVPLGMSERDGVWRRYMSTEDIQRRWGSGDE